MKTTEKIITAVDNAIIARKEQLPAVQAEHVHVTNQVVVLRKLQALIEGHLAELANPREEYPLEKGFDSKTAGKRVVLGGNSSSGNKQEKLEKYLRHDATAANDAILAALKGEEDLFNKYLAVSIDFFNNYLFGKDEDNFKQVVIRGLIREYKQWVLHGV